MNAFFYDIESLDNVFTLANFRENENQLELYYLLDEPYKSQIMPDTSWVRPAGQRILEVNKNFNGEIIFYDLSNVYSMIHLAGTFGLSDVSGYNKLVNDPNLVSDFDNLPLYDMSKGSQTGDPIPHLPFRPVCDTDPAYRANPERYPYLFGYNSYNYDTSMLALLYFTLFQKSFTKDPMEKDRILFLPQPNAANILRGYNDDMFARYRKNMPSYLKTVNDGNGFSLPQTFRQNMILTGRHLDVAALNEKQQHVGLKRLLGMLGYQIKESDKLKTGQNTIRTLDELCELFAYNTSDVVNLPKLLYHKAYISQFELKKGLLRDYPELIYEKKKNEYAPDIRPEKVRYDRQRIDSSSANLAAGCLCPYGHLTDIPVVSFDYPSERKAKELGIPRVNVLDEAKKFLEGLYPPDKFPEINRRFDVIYRYYKSIEGHNFNDCDYFYQDYRDDRAALAKYPNLAKEFKENAYRLKAMPIPPYDVATGEPGDMTWIPYFDGDGNETSCFALFSTGGVHGAEYNKALYESDMDEWLSKVRDMDEVQRKFPDPVDLRKAKTVTMDDGRVLPYKDFLVGGRRIDLSEYKDLLKIKPKRLKLTDSGKMSLHPKYTFTSLAPANHEDFKSYYPNLLRMMEAFFNAGLGYDRYGEIFFQKEYYGFIMKEKNADLSKAKIPREKLEACQKLRQNCGLTIDEWLISAEERGLYDNMRNGTKLVLNSASGKADAKYQNPIRVNNQIISMRIIG